METDEAIRRVKAIVPMLRADVRTAILSHAVLEASNDIIPKGMDGQYSVFFDTYNAVQNALTLKLAMDLARIFDLSNPRRWPPHEQDKASVQVLAALFSRNGLRERLESDASEWCSGIEHIGTTEDIQPQVLQDALDDMKHEWQGQDRASCQRAIDDFLALSTSLDTEGSAENAALGRIREFRDRRLAHSLFDRAPDELPKYSDLHLLLKMATEAAKLASLAAEGLSTEFGDRALRNRENAEGYARCVLDGLKRAAGIS